MTAKPSIWFALFVLFALVSAFMCGHWATTGDRWRMCTDGVWAIFCVLLGIREFFVWKMNSEFDRVRRDIEKSLGKL